MASVKTAVSIDASLFERAEALAGKMALSRSRIYSLAIQEFLEKLENRKLLAQINAAYEDPGRTHSVQEKAARRETHRRLVEGTW